MTEIRIDPAVALGLRATFTTEELRQLHEDAVNEQDSVTNRDPWIRLVDVLFAAAYPRQSNPPHPYVENAAHPGHCASLSRSGSGVCWHPADHADHA